MSRPECLSKQPPETRRVFWMNKHQLLTAFTLMLRLTGAMAALDRAGSTCKEKPTDDEAPNSQLPGLTAPAPGKHRR